MYDLLFILSTYAIIDPSLTVNQKQMDIEFSQIIITLCNLIVGFIQLLGAITMIFFKKYRKQELIYYFMISLFVISLVWLFSSTGQHYFDLVNYEIATKIYWFLMGFSGIIANIYLYKVSKLSKL